MIEFLINEIKNTNVEIIFTKANLFLSTLFRRRIWSLPKLVKFRQEQMKSDPQPIA